MPDDFRSSTARAEGTSNAPSLALSPSLLQEALTPRGLFTNLFPVSLESANLGVLRQTTKAKKAEFADRRRPWFYQSGNVLYAYGEGLDEFKDPRFTPAIVAIEQEPEFVKHLVKFGLSDFFRRGGYLVRSRWNGLSVIDNEEIIASADSSYLNICPEYRFQPFRLEGANGTPIYAFSIEASWVTVPGFEIGARLVKFAESVAGLKLVLRCKECGPHCPLHERLDNVLGVFDSFAEDGAELTTRCRCEDYTPRPIRVRQRVRSKGGAARRGVQPPERTVIVPGQVVIPASGQRGVLRLFRDRSNLEKQGQIWLGDLTSTGKVRTGGLKIRYEHIQRFLARIAGHETGAISFTLSTGPKATLERVPVTAEELAE